MIILSYLILLVSNTFFVITHLLISIMILDESVYLMGNDAQLVRRSSPFSS